MDSFDDPVDGGTFAGPTEGPMLPTEGRRSDEFAGGCRCGNRRLPDVGSVESSEEVE